MKSEDENVLEISAVRELTRKAEISKFQKSRAIIENMSMNFNALFSRFYLP